MVRLFLTTLLGLFTALGVQAAGDATEASQTGFRPDRVLCVGAQGSQHAHHRRGAASFGEPEEEAPERDPTSTDGATALAVPSSPPSRRWRPATFANVCPPETRVRARTKSRGPPA